jgi:hypothetical protein
VARPSTLTAQLEGDLLVLLAAGMSAAAAARALGMPERTVRRWARQLADRVEQNRGAGPSTGALEEARLTTVLLRSSDWRASARWLETHYPERWAEREPREITPRP